MSELGEAWNQADKNRNAIDEMHAKLMAVELAVHELVSAVESARKDGSVPGAVLRETSSKAVELGWELDALESDEDEPSDWGDDEDDDEDFHDSPLGWSDDEEDDWDDEDWDDEDWSESEWDDDDDDWDDDDDGDDGNVEPDGSAGPVAPLGNSGQSRIVNLCEDDVRKWGGLAS